MASSASEINGTRNEAESEWEYEYADDEFEDHYVLLEMPTSKLKNITNSAHPVFSLYVPPQSRKGAISRTTTPRKHKRRKRNKETGELDPLSDPGEDEVERPEEAGDGQANSSANPHAQALENQVKSRVEGLTDEDNLISQTKEPVDETSIQILDLHTKQPLISYRGQIYQCHWGTTLGTDMFFKKQPQDEEERQQSQSQWDLLGLSSARLLAKEARITHKTQQQNELAAPAATQAGQETQHASFLRRFVDLQVRKGEVSAAGAGPSSRVAQNGRDGTRTDESEALRVMFAGPLASAKGTREYSKANKRRKLSSAVETLIGGDQGEAEDEAEIAAPVDPALSRTG